MQFDADARRSLIDQGDLQRCMIDTLLSGAFETISDARDETSRLAGWDAQRRFGCSELSLLPSLVRGTRPGYFPQMVGR
ncbi:hypothetical protein GU700_21815 [Methylobacterium sp. NI91]|nr:MULTISPECIES: hypothetical protein [unclassified Methylobacterium]QIJ76977.1 hypothetical protein CLZ_21815 [Methylobacterium sp. CLZ]QIJ81880.1 hypothetical protein GU700_21815 [Methylobacterium sp. NI91]